MARLYSNENFPLPVVVALRLAGHEVPTSLEAGKANQRVPDDQVLAYATAQGRALLTLNRRDFIRLHKLTPAHAGIIACTVDAGATQSGTVTFSQGKCSVKPPRIRISNEPSNRDCLV